MNKIAKRNANAFTNRAAKAAAHEALMAQHAARKAEYAMWATAYDAWIAAGERGPRPIRPRH